MEGKMKMQPYFVENKSFLNANIFDWLEGMNEKHWKEGKKRPKGNTAKNEKGWGTINLAPFPTANQFGGSSFSFGFGSRIESGDGKRQKEGSSVSKNGFVDAGGGWQRENGMEGGWGAGCKMQRKKWKEKRRTLQKYDFCDFCSRPCGEWGRWTRLMVIGGGGDDQRNGLLDWMEKKVNYGLPPTFGEYLLFSSPFI
jgi:hypothetical protein